MQGEEIFQTTPEWAQVSQTSPKKKPFKVDRKIPMKISSHYSVTHTSFQIISWSSGFWQKPFPPKQSLENAQQKKKSTAKKIKKQRKQEGETAKGKNLGGQCQNKPQNVPSVHSKSPEALASGTDSNII